jgi:serine/threonine protein kinase
MAPELLSGGAYSDKVDVYAAGVMLNEMLTRQVRACQGCLH